MTLLF